MSYTSTLELAPEKVALGLINEAVQEIADAEDWSPELVFQIELIIEEICTNVIDYGDVADEEPIKVLITSNDQEIRIEITDKGKAFDPTAADTPEKLTSIETSDIGGWGIHLTHTLTDEMRYQRIDHHNILTLVKRRAA